MTDRLLAVLAFALVAAFLGILVWHVPRLDLAALCLVTLLFIAADFFILRPPRRNRR